MTKATTVEQKEGFTVLNYSAPANKNIDFPKVKPNLGLVLSGDLPGWLYFYIGNFYQDKCQWLAIDDLLSGAIVVVSQTPGINVGDIIPLEGKS